MDTQHLPSDLGNLRGVQQGLFKVQITHPKIKIPEKYNTKSMLGKEVSAETGETYWLLELSSR